MKIAILGPAPPFRGGISLFALNLAKAFRNLGHQVLFINFIHQYPKLLFPGKDQYDNSLEDSSFKNLRLVVPWNPLSWQRAVKAIKQEHTDMIIVSWFLPFFAPAFGYIQRRLPKVTKIILAHNVRPHEKWPLAKVLQSYAFNPADRIVVLSKASFIELMEAKSAATRSKAVEAFHPIEPFIELFHAQSPSKELLFFGLIKPYKGLDILLKAMPLILREYPDAVLHIAGEVYGSTSQYQELIHDLGIANNVVCDFRYIRSEEISPLFNNAQLCILPYKSASQSGVIATAYQHGVPVVASNVGGLGEYVWEGKTGYLVAPNNPPQLAAAIINHFKYKPDMTTDIRNYINKFSWHELAKLLISL